MNTQTSGITVDFPQALKAVNNWCLWKLESIDGRTTKVPYMKIGKRASSNNIKTWSSFDTVSEILSKNRDQFSGYGFMIADGFAFIDIDHCLTANGMDERGKDILSAFPDSYCEISQSGTGLHIITKGDIPRCFNSRKTGVEMYNFGRFCALTGKAIQAKEPTEEPDGILYVFNKYATKPAANARTCSELPTGISTHSDKWIISHASQIDGKKGHDFRTLFYDGDISGFESASEADSALCTLLAFWCDRNESQMDRLFRRSALFRPKWERPDYRLRTLSHACNFIPESLSEYQIRMNRERASAIAKER